MKHTLNVPRFQFVRIADGSKTFLLAEDETGFQSGDEVELLEFDESKINSVTSAKKGLTGQKANFQIGFITHLSTRSTILSLLPMKKASAKKS